MTRTLGDITNELKEKVLSPAKEEAERRLGEARSQADKIILEAKKEASQIKEKAKKDAEQTVKQMERDLATSARNFVLLVEERLEEAIVRPVVEEEVKSVFEQKDFLSSIIEIVVKKFIEIHGKDNSIELLLPEQNKKELEEWFVNKFMYRAVQGLNVRFTDKFSFGFKLSFDETKTYVNFGEGLVEVFSEFCSPRFRKYFFMATEGK